MPKLNMNRLPPRQSRGEGAADLATRFLGVKLTPDGMSALAATIEGQLTGGSSTATLEEVRAIILANPTWIDGPVDAGNALPRNQGHGEPERADMIADRHAAFALPDAVADRLDEVAAQYGTTLQELVRRLAIHLPAVAEVLPASAFRPRRDQSEQETAP